MVLCICLCKKATRITLTKNILALTIIDKEENRIIGSTSIGNISKRDKRAEIGWTWIAKEYQGKGIGKMIVAKFQEKYKSFHMQMLTADGKAIDFYKKVGFEKAGETMPMWIYNGDEH